MYSKSLGGIDHKDHTTFLNMWLEKYVFCGKSVDPTTHYQRLAEFLADGNSFPQASIGWDPYISYCMKYLSI